MMKRIAYSIVTAALCALPVSLALAQDMNPGNSGGGHDPIGIPTYPGEVTANPALTTGSRFSVTADTPPVANPTVPGATGLAIVRGDNSTISRDRRATVMQKATGQTSDGSS